ncbi:hypothetical protein CGRA01v4_10214 [Colletotrichum graminicola]|nr:hypothetical protein CGRA01v4_10214 [Colletotrichum graminicola]
MRLTCQDRTTRHRGVASPEMGSPSLRYFIFCFWKSRPPHRSPSYPPEIRPF